MLPCLKKRGNATNGVIQLCGSLTDESKRKRNSSPATARRLTGAHKVSLANDSVINDEPLTLALRLAGTGDYSCP
jgi:hypothetical protein